MSIETDAGARVRAAQRRAPQHVLGPQVRRVRELPLHLERAVRPQDALADAAVRGRCRSLERRDLGRAHAATPARGPARRAGRSARAGRARSPARSPCAARRPRRRRVPRRPACARAGRRRTRAPRPGRRCPACQTSSTRQSAMSASLPTSSDPISSSRPRQRAPWIVPSASASRARQRLRRRRAAARRAAPGAARPPARPPRSRRRRRRRARPRAPARSRSTTGAMPAPSRAFELGQCATPVPVAPKRAISAASRWTQCASQTSSPSQPSRRGTRPAAAEALLAELLLVERLGQVRVQPHAARRASAADSVIRSSVTENGEQGARAIRIIAPGEGSW